MLATKFDDSLIYRFVNQRLFLPVKGDTIDNGLLVIGNIRLSRAENSSNKVCEYRISNDRMFLSPGPTYNGSRFGHEFAYNIKLPDDFPTERISEETTLEFDVYTSGAMNFRITKSIDKRIDDEVLRVMKMFRKNWKPLEINGEPIPTTSRMHLFFYVTFEELPWKESKP